MGLQLGLELWLELGLELGPGLGLELELFPISQGILVLVCPHTLSLPCLLFSP